MRRFMSLVAGAVCGALVGATVALLIAPFSGEELRARARERMATFTDEVRLGYESRKAQLEAELEALRSAS